MAKRIKPCPRCGDRLHLHNCHVIWPKNNQYHYIRCGYCDFIGPKRRTKFMARRAWNKTTNILEIREEGEENGKR